MAGANRSSTTKLDRRKLARLYIEDETAWIELTSRLVKQRRFHELDAKNLAEFLNDMAKRDRREVKSRLTVLIVHLLKWEHQHHERTRSWRKTIVTQRNELQTLLESGTLRNHAENVLEKAYANAVGEAAAETGINEEMFPRTCPYTIEGLLEDDEER